MTREEAYFEKMLLICGFHDGYDARLDHYLTVEDPLSDIVLDLVDCGGDWKQAIHCLHRYCQEGAVDEDAVCEMLRLYLKDAYDSGRMTQDEIVAAMYRFARSKDDPYDNEWLDMIYLSDALDLVESLDDADEKLTEQFNRAFEAYLYDGVPVDMNAFWTRYTRRTPRTILYNIGRKLFRKKQNGGKSNDPETR